MSFPRAQWRLLYSQSLPGAYNMALDEAILEAVVAGDSPPTLRFYAWSPPCLSLGYAQPIADVDLQAIEQHGWQVVRRPTGGRAILHTDELTYSVTGRQDDPRLDGGVLESYQRLAGALLVGLELLGLPVRVETQRQRPQGAEPEPICFEVPGRYEITFNGKKLIGSAQSRRIKGVLQHGSLPLYGDLSRITQALAFPDEASRQQAALRLLDKAITVEGVLGYRITWLQAANAFSQAFSDCLNLEMISGELTAAEIGRAEQLVAEKYGHPNWTNSK